MILNEYVQELTVKPMIDYFKIHGVPYSRSQLPIINAYALTVHKTQSLTLNSIAVSLDSTMFAQGHGYTALSRVSEFKEVRIIALCKEAFKVDPEAVGEYERLKKVYDDIVLMRR